MILRENNPFCAKKVIIDEITSDFFSTNFKRFFLVIKLITDLITLVEVIFNFIAPL